MEKITLLNDYLTFEAVKCDREELLEDFAQRNNILRINLIFENEKLMLGDRVIIKKNGKKHIVMPFETLESISNKYGLRIEDLKRKNNVSSIFIGQQLMI